MHDLLILLYYLLQLGMLLHYPLVLKSNSVMGMLLPLSCCCLQLLQSQIFLGVIRRINVELSFSGCKRRVVFFGSWRQGFIQRRRFRLLS